MSSLPGGPADKAGLSHEALWGVVAMLKVLHGQATEIRIEPPSIDAAEFYVQTKPGREYWQAKRQLLSQQTWTLTALNREKVLGFFLDRSRAGDICVFVSITDAPEFRTLADDARAANDLGEFESKFLSKERRINFNELCRFWNDSTPSEAFDYLRRIRVEGGQEATVEGLLVCLLDVSFEGSPQAALDCLQQLYLNSVHQTLNAQAIESHLETRGIKRRAAALDPSVCDKLLRTTDSYLAGQQAKLIRGQPIPRQAAKEIAEKLKGTESALDIALVASAGGGKSGCLFQLATNLREAAIPVFAFRLDRVRPVQTTIALGEQFGLPDSPAVVLARCFPGQRCVLLIDQLDFVSSTSGRHPDFFDVVAALIEEARGLRATSLIHLVIACRKFDFEHDHRLRSLLRKEDKPIELALLTADEVKVAVSSAGGNVSFLSPRQIELLRLPQNLSLFIDADLAQQPKPAFISQKDLFDEYWEAKQRELISTHPNEMTHWKPLIDKLTRDMSERQELSVPKSRLDESPAHFVNALISAGVLTVDENRYGFRHESLFDYCFARGVASMSEEFVAVLENDEQQLFRRAQLRQVLVYLRDDDFKRYLENVRLALMSSKIRPHLKLLVLDLLGALPEPRDEELALLMPFIDSELDYRRRKETNPQKIASRAFEVFFHSASLFRVADRLEYIQRWLNSGEDWLEDLMMLYLRRQTDENADRVAEIVEPFVGKGGRWTDRLRYLMEWRSHDKGRKYFELFLRLIDDGTLDDARDRFAMNGTFWIMLHGLSERHPAWCAEVAAHCLRRRVARGLAQKTGDYVRIELDDDFGVDDLFESARRASKAFLTEVLPAIIHAAEATQYPNEGALPRDQVWAIHSQSDHIGLDNAYLRGCDTAFEELAKAGLIDEMRPFIATLLNSRLYTSNLLLQHAYFMAPEVFAEEAMLLLVSEPERLFCDFSDNAFWISRCLIEKCSPHCSESTFEKLETVLLNFTTPVERSKDGLKVRGLAAFNLLSALPPQRRSNSVTARFEELGRKFGTPKGPPRPIRAYTVESPIAKEAAEHMNDDNWLNAIAKHNKPRAVPDWEHPERGGAYELAGMLQQFVEKEPERFVHLALRFPSGTNVAFFTNVLYGLKKADISSDLKIEVVRRVTAFDDNDCAKAALNVLGSLKVYPLPDDLCNFIKTLAVDHPDPEKEQWEGEQPYYGGDILRHGINTVRGRAAEAIRDLIWYDERYLQVFLLTVTRIVNDKTLSVRSCVASTLIAVAGCDAGAGISLFSQLTQTDDRLLGTPYAEKFISYALREHFGKLRVHIERMLQSEYASVKQIAGRLACLARLYHQSADDLGETALAGDSCMRLRAAEVAENNLVYPECRGWCEAALVRLFNDGDHKVRNQASRCFWHLWKNTEIPLASFNSLIAVFTKSKAFTEEPSMLLHALEDTRQQMPETTLDVCDEFVTKCAAQARDISTGIAADEITIGKLVFRSYAQFQSRDLKLRALSLIDRMCEEGLHSASKNLVEFDR
jgi:hypothetical protein